MSTSDVYQVRMFYTAGENPEELINVYYYQQTGGFSGVPNAADMVGEFLDNVWDLVRDLQPDTVTTRKYTCININDPSDYVEGFPNSVGNRDALGYLLPSFVCAAIRSPREAAGDRYSYKRISGLQSGDIAANVAWAGTTLTLLDAIATAHGTQLEGTNGTYEPVQVAAGWSLGSAPTIRQSLMGFWAYNTHPSHQVTRQEGLYAWVTV